MASWTHAVATASTSNVEIYTSGSFTPAEGDLLVVVISISGTTAPFLGPVTTSTGITFSYVGEATPRTLVFVANSLVPASPSAMTAQWDGTGDSGTGCTIIVARLAGMTRTGLSAVRQFKTQNSGTSGTTPSVVLDAACLTGNPTVAAVGIGGVNPAAITEPSGWTEQADTGFASPAVGQEYATRDSGFTGTTVTWGSTAGGSFGAIVVEFDTSALPTRKPSIIMAVKSFVAQSRRRFRPAVGFVLLPALPLTGGPQSGSVTYGGVGTFSANGTVTKVGAFSAAGAGTVAFASTVAKVGAVSFGGVGTATFAADVTAGFSAAVAFSGVSTAAFTASVSKVGVFAATGTGTAAFSGTVSKIGAFQGSGAGTFAIAATVTKVGAFAGAGAGSVSFAATVSKAGASAFAGAGTAAFSGSVTKTGAVNYSGTGTVAFAATTQLPAVQFAGSGTVAFAATVTPAPRIAALIPAESRSMVLIPCGGVAIQLVAVPAESTVLIGVP